jgi:hypothetical protein
MTITQRALLATGVPTIAAGGAYRDFFRRRRDHLAAAAVRAMLRLSSGLSLAVRAAFNAADAACSG